jgi:hypothetical protein
MATSPFERLMNLARFATGVGLDATYEVKVYTRSSGKLDLCVTVHDPSAEFIREAIERFGATTEGWMDCSDSGSPDNVFRSWNFSPEEAMEFVVYERPPRGVLLKDLPVEETREYIRAAEAEEVA